MIGPRRTVIAGTSITASKGVRDRFKKKYGKAPALSTRAVANYYPKRLSGTMQQAQRTGGWVAPGAPGNGELKYVDIKNTSGQTADPMGTSGVWQVEKLLNPLLQGTTASQRVGRKVTMQSFLFRWRAATQVTTTVSGKVRLLVVYDRQTNIQPPNPGDVFEDPNNYLSPNALANRDRFTTLMEIESDSFNGQATGGFKESDTGTVFKRLPLEVCFNGTNGGGIGDITSGSVYLLSCYYGFNTSPPTLQYYSRIRYTDV